MRGKSANLPAITDKDWEDIKFGVDVGVDYYALSFVRSAEVIYELKRYLSKQNAAIGVLAKIESADSVQVRQAGQSMLTRVHVVLSSAWCMAMGASRTVRRCSFASQSGCTPLERVLAVLLQRSLDTVQSCL